MDQETVGTIVAVYRQWWLKVNRKPVRRHAMDGAEFPHVLKVRYSVDGKDYFKRKWIRAGAPVPVVGSPVVVLYDGTRPSKAKVFS